jgi:hypothetical protein
MAPEETDDLSGHAHRQLIGWLGVLLPFLLLLLAAWRPHNDAERWSRLASLSAYYHTGAVPAFVGVLVALGLFLLAYRGFGNKDGRKDRIATTVAGLSALGVAAFPTSAPAGYPAPGWLTGVVSGIHYGSALVLFLCFAFFALVLFRHGSGALTAGKRLRNGIYLACGIAIIGALATIAVFSITDVDDIFWPEAVAIWAFGISWLMKGRADYTIKAAVRKLTGG